MLPLVVEPEPSTILLSPGVVPASSSVMLIVGGGVEGVAGLVGGAAAGGTGAGTAGSITSLSGSSAMYCVYSLFVRSFSLSRRYVPTSPLESSPLWNPAWKSCVSVTPPAAVSSPMSSISPPSASVLTIASCSSATSWAMASLGSISLITESSRRSKSFPPRETRFPSSWIIEILAPVAVSRVSFS